MGDHGVTIEGPPDEAARPPHPRETAGAAWTSNLEAGSLEEAQIAGIAVLDRDGKVVEANPILQKLLGCPSDEIVGRHLLDFTISPSARKDRELFARVLREHRTGLLVERRLQSRNGRETWGRVSVFPLQEAEGRHAALAAIEDVSIKHGLETRIEVLEKALVERRRETEDRFADEEAARREAEEARKQIEGVLESITDSFIALDPEWRFVYLNHHAEEYLNTSRDAAIGRNIWELFPRSVGTIIHRSFFQARDRGATVEFELFESKSDRWFDVRVFPSEAGLSVYFRDVTEKRLASQRETSLAAVADLTPDFIGVADADGKLLFLNQAGRELMGLGPAEDLNEHDVFELHPEGASRTLLDEALPQLIRDGRWVGETVALAHDGREIPVSAVLMAQRGEDGEIETFSTIWRDISTRKAQEERKRFVSEASHRLMASLELDEVLRQLPRIAIPMLGDFCNLVMLDGDFSHQVAEAHVDVEKEERLRELRRFRFSAPGSVGVGRALAMGEAELVPEASLLWERAAAVDEEHFRLLRSLELRSLMFVPLKARQGVFGALSFGITGDSPRRFGPDDLAAARELATIAAFAIDNARLYGEARRSAHVRDEVLGIVSHDLRGPLSIISIATERLLRAADDEKRDHDRKNLEVILRAAHRANRLVDDLLDVTRMQIRKMVISPVPTPASSLVEDALKLYRGVAKKKGLRLEGSAADGLPEVLADRERIPQVFANLIGNAIKFTPSGGKVSIQAGSAEKGVRFVVNDTGSGIPKSEIPHIFDAFWQARRGSKESAGLGLAIVKGIVQAHGGEVGVQSEPGRGSTFEFTLPTSAAP
ncbi:PAS domain-containing protein [Vulgatibacter incomptus]|uniref:histidine kinase n=1 Tax=Vulgatibacter incomptus TaxID=1391653 RepID=A0A0K1PEU0_9BACT|nr:PAS domain-containing protein [Vulgatibacter incomptus]AKU92017.1 diguanylate cyclase/phosphodiesterase (GGDEF & EAL domains) with PAS/PAC sensor(s) [Vulgatibacter incomptus]